MSKKNIKLVFILLIASIILIFSGKHLLVISEVNTLFDGLMVMIFFLSLFPFLSLFSIILNKVFKSISHVKNY
ncbi:MAG: hypothetical protein ACI9Q3_001012 [Maribacter sp.]|jgi:hypothetical protein